MITLSFLIGGVSMVEELRQGVSGGVGDSKLICMTIIVKLYDEEEGKW